MSTKLVIVESPTKARTITRFLGDEARVLASMGHVRDLPESSLGVDIQHRFQPVYVLTRNGKRVFDGLKSAARGAKEIYLATDPDREGEAIAWHIQELLQPVCKKAAFHRVAFHEITRTAIEHAFATPGTLDLNKVDAQQARRVLDRLVGYQVSPMLWRNIQKGTSAGRVQSVALRLICDRQREIDGFQPVEYWTLDAEFATDAPAAVFTARLAQLDGKRLPFDSEKNSLIPDAAAANALAAELESAATYRVAQVNAKPRQQRAAPPFITSTLQQAAGANLSMGTGQTMRVAQELYEGVDIGDGPVGLITYMRTDSVEVAKEAQAAAREYIARTFGPDYVPPSPNVYRSKASAQGAHEAIRPTDVSRTPEAIAAHLSPQQLRVYRLIWNRFMASQMAPARLLDNTIDVEALGNLQHSYLFRAAATSVLFPGFRRLYDLKDIESTKAPEPVDDEPKNGTLPNLPEGTPCALRNLDRAQSFTKPPPAYTEATLVKELEQNGIGRPSTYASIVETIQDREYVSKEKGRLSPTTLGFSVNDFLVKTLPDLFQVGFTAEMENELDQVEEGKLNWTAMLEAFYVRFQKWGGAVAAPAGAPGNERVLRVLNLFPADLAWKPAEKRGRRTFDDHKFHASLMEQATGAKPVSDKQWQAILALGARYADELPELLPVARELGVEPQVLALIERVKNPVAPTPVAEAAMALAVEIQPLLDALKGVTWEAPVKRGRRTFDDKRFFNSLSRQVGDARGMSQAQVDALKRLVARYAGQIPDFAALSARFILAPTADAESSQEAQSPEVRERTTTLIGLLDGITEWQPAQQRGRRTYDDKQFVTSVRDQFTRKGSLSPRQIEAMTKLLRKYCKHQPELAQKTELAGISAIAPPPQPLDAKCPTCGAPLVARQARGRTFYGCSTFPKCRFAASKLPTGETPDADTPKTDTPAVEG